MGESSAQASKPRRRHLPVVIFGCVSVEICLRTMTKQIFCSCSLQHADNGLAEFSCRVLKLALIFPTSMMTAVLIEPGLVLLRDFVDKDKCQEPSNMACQRSEDGDDDFCADKDGSKVLNRASKEAESVTRLAGFLPK
jgi:hypothetical protein